VGTPVIDLNEACHPADTDNDENIGNHCRATLPDRAVGRWTLKDVRFPSDNRHDHIKLHPSQLIAHAIVRRFGHRDRALLTPPSNGYSRRALGPAGRTM
jgi:hypothetical protein